MREISTDGIKTSLLVLAFNNEIIERERETGRQKKTRVFSISACAHIPKSAVKRT